MQMQLGFIGENSLEGVERDSQFAKQHGFDGLEYNYWGEFAELTADTIARMRAIHEAHDVQVAMLGLWGWNHLSRDPAERRGPRSRRSFSSPRRAAVPSRRYVHGPRGRDASGPRDRRG